MDNLFASEPSLVRFDYIYKQNITPKLQAIDVFLKTNDPPYSVESVAQCLHMSSKQVLSIMENLHLKSIERLDFFIILSHSSSYICKLVQRQWKYAYSKLYTPEMIAYIYELNINKVLSAFENLQKYYIEEADLMTLFSYILVPIFTLRNSSI